VWLIAVEWPLPKVQRSIAWRTRNDRFRRRLQSGSKNLSSGCQPCAVSVEPRGSSAAITVGHSWEPHSHCLARSHHRLIQNRHGTYDWWRDGYSHSAFQAASCYTNSRSAVRCTRGRLHSEPGAVLDTRTSKRTFTGSRPRKWINSNSNSNSAEPSLKGLSAASYKASEQRVNHPTPMETREEIIVPGAL
jgi:hypothetical protein